MIELGPDSCSDSCSDSRRSSSSTPHSHLNLDLSLVYVKIALCRVRVLGDVPVCLVAQPAVLDLPRRHPRPVAAGVVRISTASLLHSFQGRTYPPQFQCTLPSSSSHFVASSPSRPSPHHTIAVMAKSATSTPNQFRASSYHEANNLLLQS